MISIFVLSLKLVVFLSVGHALLLRFMGSRFYVTRSLLTFGVFMVGWSFLSSLDLETRLIVVITVGLFWAGKMTFVVNLLNSVCLKMVQTLAAVKENKLDRREFFAQFSEDRNLAARVQLLEANRLVERVQSDGRIQLTARGARLARIFATVQRVFRIGFVG